MHDSQCHAHKVSISLHKLDLSVTASSAERVVFRVRVPDSDSPTEGSCIGR